MKHGFAAAASGIILSNSGRHACDEGQANIQANARFTVFAAFDLGTTRPVQAGDDVHEACFLAASSPHCSLRGKCIMHVHVDDGGNRTTSRNRYFYYARFAAKPNIELLSTIFSGLLSLWSVSLPSSPVCSIFRQAISPVQIIIICCSKQQPTILFFLTPVTGIVKVVSLCFSSLINSRLWR